MNRTPKKGLLRRALRGLLVVGLLLVVAVAAVVVVVRSGGASEPARRLAVQVGSRVLGADLFVQRIDVTSLMPPRVVVTGLTLHARGGAQDGLPLVRFDRVDVALASLPDPRERVVAIDRVTVEGPAARVAHVDGVLRDFEPIIARLRPLDGAPAPTGAPWAVQLGSLDVKKAAVRVSAEPADLGFAVQGLDLGLDRIRRGGGRGAWRRRPWR